MNWELSKVSQSVIYDGDVAVAFLATDYRTRDDVMRNAKVIAAAPELKRATMMLLDFVSEADAPAEKKRAIEFAKKAIEKASVGDA